MEDDTHYYGKQLNIVDPLAPTPTKIKVPLKPHQQAALAKAMHMERTGCIWYDVPAPEERSLRTEQWRSGYAYRGKMKVHTNIGILGDLVGYGKTLTALSIIAATESKDIHNDNEYHYSTHGRHVARFTAICDRPNMTPANHFINATLVVVPRGPVYMQWLHAIQNQTSMKVLAIDGIAVIRSICPPQNASIQEMKEFFEQFDIVLIKNTTLPNLMSYYNQPYVGNPIVAWNRIMVDESHDIIKALPFFDYKFMWLITATYYELPTVLYYGRSDVVSSLREIVTEDNMPFLMVQGNRDFVKSSFTVPDMVENYYMCHLGRNISAVQPFLSNAVLERINANDIAGAIRELGGTNETEEDLVAIVTRDIQKDIRNKEHEISYTTHLEVSPEYKQTRLASLHADLKRLQDKLQSLTERVSHLSSKTCGICYDTFDNPIMLPCSHIFCGQCIISWMRNASNRTCPECRTSISSNKLIAIVNQKSGVAELASLSKQVQFDKVEMLVVIIKNRPQGRFLVFSRIESSFYPIMGALEKHGITYDEIKGSTAQMMKKLERFQRGELRVIMLNTHHAGSGIDISCATDVVVFHQMGADKVQAIGRAQRVGRTQPLHVHNLCYPHEIGNDFPARVQNTVAA
jgi:superfamily II DNA or RNA helicase